MVKCASAREGTHVVVVEIVAPILVHARYLYAREVDHEVVHQGRHVVEAAVDSHIERVGDLRCNVTSQHKGHVVMRSANGDLSQVLRLDVMHPRKLRK